MKEEYYKTKIKLLEAEKTCVILGRFNSDYFQTLKDLQKYQKYDWYDVKILSDVSLLDLKEIEIQLISIKQQLRNCQNESKKQLKMDIMKWQEENGKNIVNANGSEENFLEAKEKALKYIDLQLNFLCRKRTESEQPASIDNEILKLLERKQTIEAIEESKPFEYCDIDFSMVVF